MYEKDLIFVFNLQNNVLNIILQIEMIISVIKTLFSVVTVFIC